MSDLANKDTGAGANANPGPAATASSAEASGDEFANVPSPRTRHPALAIAAALLAFFIVYYKHSDLAYSVSSSEPLELGEARALFAAPERVASAANRYVRVAGVPDRENALELDTKGSWILTQFFRVLGTGGRLFVHRRENPLPGYRAEQDVFEGRLIRISELSFQSAIRGYYATHVSATHFFAPSEVLRAVVTASGGALAMPDVAGDEVRLGPADLLAIDVSRPEEVRIGLPRDKFPDETGARGEIEKRGGVVSGPAETVSPNGQPSERYTFVVRFPAERRHAALGELGDLDRKVEIRESRETHKVRVADISAGDGALSIRDASGKDGAGHGLRILLTSIASVRTLAAVQIPDDAYLLIEADMPRDHFHTVIASALLLLFGAVNLIGLAQGLRR